MFLANALKLCTNVFVATASALHRLIAGVQAYADTTENIDGTTEILTETLLESANILVTPTAFSTGTLHSLIDTTGDFNVTSDTDATRINENGIIEDIANNQPRINYTPSASGTVANSGHILLEPTRTNLERYSQGGFDNFIWGGDGNPNNTTRTDNIADPMGGTDAAEFRMTSSSGWFSAANVPTGNSFNYTHSIFVKVPSTPAATFFKMQIVSVSPQAIAQFRFSDETFTTEQSCTASFEKYPNGWYRLIMTYANGGVANNQIRHSCDDGKAIQVFGVQTELSDFATSYIPVLSTSAVTRTKGVLSDSGSTSIISSTAGVLYLEIQALGSTGNYRFFNITQATSSQSDRITLGIMNNEKAVAHIQQTTQQFSQEVTTDFNSDYVKMAFLYKAGDNNCEFFINGSDVVTSHTGVTLPTSLANLNSSDFNTAFEFEGRIKTIAYFTNELTPAQLATLTS